jgi:nucleoside-diphosphate-sugar epimerase
MRVLLTGASSFTGCWIAAALAEAGVEVVATLRRPLADYAGLSRQRLDKALAAGARPVERCAFGDARFFALIAHEGPVDLLCHHGAEVGELRRDGYDPLAALASTTANAAAVLSALARSGGRGIVVTGTVFEADHAAGRPAANAYGLAKTLISEMLRFHAGRAGLAFGRFVIPHPIGPLEKPGLTRHLIETWLAGGVALVRHPQLVRDLVPVDLLAAAYARFCHGLALEGGVRQRAPSGLVGSLGDLAEQIGAVMRPRLGRPCEVRRADPPEPSDEPPVCRNDEPLPELRSGPALARAWDRLADYYKFEQSSSILG